MSELIMCDDGDVSSETWNPSTEQLNAFRTRELQLATYNLNRPGVGKHDTFHSLLTVCEALKLLKVA